MNLLQEKTLSQLPDEVLGLVFSFLTVCEIATCARVCQQWRKLSWYWQLVLNLEPVHENVTDTTLAWIADHCKQISSLSLCRCFSITDRGLWHLYCLPKLQTLNLAYCNRITDAGLSTLATAPHISTSSLSDSGNVSMSPSINGSAPSSSIILSSSVTPSSLHITQLSLAYLFKITSAGVKQILLKPLPLRDLSLCSCHNVDEKALLELSQLTDLRSLDLSMMKTHVMKNGIRLYVGHSELFHHGLSKSHRGNATNVSRFID
jgi:hypothetical protein